MAAEYVSIYQYLNYEDDLKYINSQDSTTADLSSSSSNIPTPVSFQCELQDTIHSSDITPLEIALIQVYYRPNDKLHNPLTLYAVCCSNLVQPYKIGKQSGPLLPVHRTLQLGSLATLQDFQPYYVLVKNGDHSHIKVEIRDFDNTLISTLHDIVLLVHI